MSARALRKVLEEQESANNHNNNLSPVDESESEPDSPRPFSNPFDLLNEQEQEQENESSDVDTPSTLKKEDDVNKNIATKLSSTNQKSKKKKKKKNKAKELSSNTDDADSLDLVLKDLSLGFDNQPSKQKSENVNGSGKRSTSNILQIDPKLLSADNELRRIFGSKVVNSFEKSNQAGSSRQNRSGRRGIHSYKKTNIISPSEHWPRWDGSLSMELLENKNGYSYFRYVHSSSYNLAQRQFESAKLSHDLNTIASILLHHPYHLDSLITLAEYFKFSGELQMSSDSTAKALYALECAWPASFTPFQSNCQLKYEHDTNKPFFTTLFTHMKNMDRRGCHRSALEICKLLISLDSDDPMGALFCIDYFSLRAEEYKWLERFSEEYNSDNSLWLFPNFSYSLAICRFYLERVAKTESESKATASDLMKQAIMLHPTVINKLVVKVPLKEQVWSKIVNHSFFRKDETGNASLDHLINIYVEKSYIIWRLPELHNFLKDTALSVIEKMEINQSEARDLACVRNEAFASDKNEYSHLMVSDFSDSTPTIPPEILQNFMIDPRLVEMHNNNNIINANQEYVGGVVRAPPREVANRNALAVLFESMLPWADFGTREEDDMPHDDED